MTAPEAVARPKRRGLKRLLRALLVIFIVVLLVLFARTVNWHEAWTSIRSADRRWITAAALANLLSIGLKGVRWWVFLRKVGVRPLSLALRATLAGAGLNNVLVANGGEAARVVFVSRTSGVSGATILATLAIERAFDLVGYVIMLALATLVLPLPANIERWRIPAAAAALLSIGLLAFAAYKARGRRIDIADVAPLITDVPAEEIIAESAPLPGVGKRLRAFGERFMDALAATAGAGAFASALVLSLAAWALQIATFAWTARAAGLTLPLAGDVATLLAVNLGFLLRATPGNVGFFQLAYAIAAAPFGAPRDEAIAVALLIQTLQIIPVTLLGIALAPEFLLHRHRPAGTPAPPRNVTGSRDA
jgi:uncharacterized protein (TIRG00374 family)